MVNISSGQCDSNNNKNVRNVVFDKFKIDAHYYYWSVLHSFVHNARINHQSSSECSHPKTMNILRNHWSISEHLDEYQIKEGQNA